LPKVIKSICTRKGIDHVNIIGTQLNTAGVSYILLPLLPLLHCSVNYDHKETVEHQQTKELSREHNICCSNEVVLGSYDCFGCITMMSQQHIAVKTGKF
jgi:pantothenate kinase